MQTVRRLLALALFVGLFAVAWRFATSNESEIRIDLLLIRTPPVAVWVALVVAFALGALSASVSLGYEVIKRSLIARRYRRVAAGLESEIHQLRNLPLVGADSASTSRAHAEGERREDGGITSRSP
jgi:hypothetical protein